MGIFDRFKKRPKVKAAATDTKSAALADELAEMRGDNITPGDVAAAPSDDPVANVVNAAKDLRDPHHGARSHVLDGIESYRASE